MLSSNSDREFLARLTVLYVEDDAAIRSSTAEFLRRRVGRLLIAEDGAEGLDIFQGEHPDMVLTDIMMPNMDGLSMAEAIKTASPETPVVVVTAFEQPQFLLRSINIGVDRYVLKPVQPNLLDAALLHCTHLIRGEQELRQHAQVERELILARHHESMSYLASGMAHDYNNLLQAILSSLEAAMAHTTPGSPANLILGMTQRFAGTAQRLGQQLMLLSQEMETLDQEGTPVPLLEAVLEEVLEGADISVNLQVAKVLPQIRYNDGRLRQVLVNLATNAQEAMPEGGTLDIDVAPFEVGLDTEDLGLAAGTYLCLRFTDSGRGIPEDQLPLIFDPYFSSKPTGAAKGQGLSLAVCRSVMRSHGGGIAAQSQVGKGSTFRLFLPAIQSSGA